MMVSSLFGRAAFIGAALGLAVAATGTAHAFTFEDQGGSNGAKGFTDLDIPKVPNAATPDSRFSTNNGVTTYKSDFGMFQFGSQPSFDQRYNSNNLFDPFYRDGR